MIRGEVETANYVFYYYPNHYEIHKIEAREISHLLHIRGSREVGILYCYLELFNTKNFIVILDRNYKGESFKQTYCYDLIKSAEVDKSVELRLTKQHLHDMIFISESHKRRIPEKVYELGRKFKAMYEKGNVRQGDL